MSRRMRDQDDRPRGQRWRVALGTATLAGAVAGVVAGGLLVPGVDSAPLNGKTPAGLVNALKALDSDLSLAKKHVLREDESVAEVRKIAKHKRSLIITYFFPPFDGLPASLLINGFDCVDVSLEHVIDAADERDPKKRSAAIEGGLGEALSCLDALHADLKKAGAAAPLDKPVGKGKLTAAQLLNQADAMIRNKPDDQDTIRQVAMDAATVAKAKPKIISAIFGNATFASGPPAGVSVKQAVKDFDTIDRELEHVYDKLLFGDFNENQGARGLDKAIAAKQDLERAVTKASGGPSGPSGSAGTGLSTSVGQVTIKSSR
jgi:hypothetical protein